VEESSTFTYDWRRDNNESADSFIEHLELVKRRHGGRPAQVIAHSNELDHLPLKVTYIAPDNTDLNCIYCP
jgi:hypothetical protein